MFFPVARASLRTASVVARRGYADAAADGALKLSLVLPHQAVYNAEGVQQVNIAATSGDMGILANHVPTVEALRPGMIEVIPTSGNSKKFFASAGFATVHPSNSITIDAVEAYELEKFSPEAVRAGLADAQRVIGSSASEQDKAEARIEVEVFEALQSALSK